MTTYELLDAIADAYTPILFLGYLVFAIIYWRKGDRLASAKGLVGIIVAYVLMFADNKSQIWKSVGLDYSTHSAVALAFIAFHVHKRRWNCAATISLVTSLVLYYALEVYQQYHTVMDIVATVAIVGPLMALIYWTKRDAYMNRIPRDRKSAPGANTTGNKESFTHERDFCLSRSDAASGGPADQSVTGEEDPGAGLEFLVNKEDVIKKS